MCVNTRFLLIRSTKYGTQSQKEELPDVNQRNSFLNTIFYKSYKEDLERFQVFFFYPFRFWFSVKELVAKNFIISYIWLKGGHGKKQLNSKITQKGGRRRMPTGWVFLPKIDEKK